MARALALAPRGEGPGPTPWEDLDTMFLDTLREAWKPLAVP